MSAKSVFAHFHEKVWPIEYEAEIVVEELVAGNPADPDVVRRWIDSAISDSSQAGAERVRELVAQTMVELGIQDEGDAVEKVAATSNRLIFKRDPDTKELVEEGRKVAACLREAVSVCLATDMIRKTGWGSTRKTVKAFFIEHVRIPENLIPLGVTEPTGEFTKFVHTFRGNSISIPHFIADARLSFHVLADYDFDKSDPGFWPMVWGKAESAIGFGADRSQGRGRFAVTKWDRIRG